MTLISTIEANNTASTYTISSIPTTYNTLVLVGINCQSGSGTSADISLQLNGVTTNTYDWYGIGYASGGFQFVNSRLSVTLPIWGCMAQTADLNYDRGSFMAWINNASSSTENKGYSFNSGGSNNNNLAFYTGTGKWRNTADAVTSIRFFTTGANIKTGTFKLYGMS
jgi:hypothetical protein